MPKTDFYVIKREMCASCDGRGVNYEPVSETQVNIVTCISCKGRPFTDVFVPLSQALQEIEEGDGDE